MSDLVKQKLDKLKQLAKEAESLSRGQAGLSKQAAYSRRQYSSGSEVGRPDHSRRNLERHEGCKTNLLRFLTDYFPDSTGLRPFSEDHLRVIARIESCILFGGRYANVVYRSFAKTTIAENATLWATLYGHRRFVPIFGANESKASEMIESIKRELQENDLLNDDFEEVCRYVRALEGKPQRCASQTCDGLPTFIEWTADTIVFPSIVDSPCSGAVIKSLGLTAASRGMKYKRPDGTQQRPDFVLIDDPQTDESAASPGQTKKRLDVIAKSILKMAGHRSSLACVVNGTVIQPDDMMDTLLDQKKSKAWQSERIPMIRKWSDAHESFWLGPYAAARHGFNPQLVGDQRRAQRAANELYLANRGMADAGCEVSWEWCYIEGDPLDETSVPEISAIQHAYNQLLDDGPEVFASECQCLPIRASIADSPAATKEQIEKKMVATPRGTIPQWGERLTAFIDVQGSMLYWMVAAWKSDFTGHVVDYGSFPDQKRAYFTLADARNMKRTLKEAFPGMSDEGRIHEGLSQLTQALLGKEWPKADGERMRIERLLIDRGFASHLIDQFIGNSSFGPLILTSKGQFYGASTRVHMSDYKKKDGEIFSNQGWIVTKGISGGTTRYVLVDTNRWKSFVHSRLKLAIGDRGSMTLCNESSKNAMLIDHIAAEECHIKSDDKTNRTCEEWMMKKVGEDNHWLDCLVGASVAASILGCRLDGQAAPRGPKPRVPLAQMGRAG